MKRISFILIAVLCLYSTIISEELLIGGNKTVLYGFDSSAMKIISVKNKKDSAIVLNSVEIGFFIDNKPVRLIEMNPKAEYIPGTSIIKIESSYQKLKFITYILSPMEEKRESLFIITNIKNGDARNSKNIKSFFLINDKYNKSAVKYDRVKKIYGEEEIALRSVTNKFTLYFTNESSYRELKFRKCSNDEDEKQEGEELFFVSETGDIERYGEKRDIVEIAVSGGYDYNQEEDIARDIIVDKEIGLWEHWHGENSNITSLKESEIKNIKQASVFLKLSQREDGAIIPALMKEYNYIKSEDMLLVSLAFTKMGHFEESKDILEYISKGILKNNEKGIADYGYEIDKNIEKKMIRGDGEVYSYYMKALYLYAVAEYVNSSNDIGMLKKEYKSSIKKQLDFLIDKIKSGIIMPDCYNGESGADSADSYLNSSLFTVEALESFYRACMFYIPENEIGVYKIKAEELKSGIKSKFIVENRLVDSIKTKEFKLRNGFVLKKSIVKDKDVIKKSFEGYKELYKLNMREISGKEELEENIMFAVAASNAEEKNEYKAVQDRIDSIILANGYVIPEYIKTSDKIKKYGAAGIDTKLNALYILMKDIGGNNGADK